jgi:hypothetical protein
MTVNSVRQRTYCREHLKHIQLVSVDICLKPNLYLVRIDGSSETEQVIVFSLSAGWYYWWIEEWPFPGLISEECRSLMFHAHHPLVTSAYKGWFIRQNSHLCCDHRVNLEMNQNSLWTKSLVLTFGPLNWNVLKTINLFASFRQSLSMNWRTMTWTCSWPI